MRELAQAYFEFPAALKVRILDEFLPPRERGKSRGFPARSKRHPLEQRAAETVAQEAYDLGLRLSSAAPAEDLPTLGRLRWLRFRVRRVVGFLADVEDWGTPRQGWLFGQVPIGPSHLVAPDLDRRVRSQWHVLHGELLDHFFAGQPIVPAILSPHATDRTPPRLSDDPLLDVRFVTKSLNTRVLYLLAVLMAPMYARYVYRCRECERPFLDVRAKYLGKKNVQPICYRASKYVNLPYITEAFLPSDDSRPLGRTVLSIGDDGWRHPSRHVTSRSHEAGGIACRRLETASVDRRLLTAAEVAGALQVHPHDVYRLAANGELRALRIGRRFRVDPSDLEEFIRARKVGAPVAQPASV